MGTVIGLTAEKGLEIEGNAVNGGTFDAFGHLILTKGDGSEVDVGSATATIVDATDTTKGIVLLASDAETVAGTDGTQAVTPLGLAALTSTATRKGLVELATSAETITGTDTARAITPADLLATKIISVLAETASPSSYPLGTSIMPLTGAATAWSVNGGIGTVLTNNVDNSSRCNQLFFNTAGGTQFTAMWARSTHVSNGGGGWTAWSPIQIVANLTPGSFVQTTAFTSYPLGPSRLIYTTANSTSWDFVGYAGEVMTYVDGTSFARQTFTQHLGGPTTIPNQWVRTATSGSGWSAWNIKPKILARRRRTTAKSGITTESGYMRLDDIPVIAGCIYEISTSSLTLDSSVDNEVMIARLRVEQNASTGTPATTSSQGITAMRNQAIQNAQCNVIPMTGYWYAATTGYISVLLSAQRVTSLGTFAFFASSTEPADLVVKLLGTDLGNSGADL